MWLRYGVDANNVLVDIEDVPSGKTQLICPYCGGQLTAKKGRIKQHHFAHTDKSCQFMVVSKNRELPTLPLYDDFSIRLSGEELEKLKVLWREYGVKKCSIPHFAVPKQFIWHGLLQMVESSTLEYQFTRLGQIPVAALPLELFNYVQEPLLLEKLFNLKQKAELASNSSLFFPERLIDYKIYCAQYQKILRQTLYYLQIKADGDTLHKIGVTQRSIEQRLVEIQRDLKQHFKSITIEVLGTWQHRGNVEKYFKYRYKNFNYKIGSLTEYYKFNSEDAAAVFRDLEQMKLKVLSEIEAGLLTSKPNKLEQFIISPRLNNDTIK
ncbi:competence protein CoiA family protein [Chroococcidiopsis sp. TS-821]|uniref:competence protein CoiA family protein n=1 Tax=Chroococcidiopsis sp. TS-821 TaxID=1378066 RepID=UPI000CEEDF03|nr:competence protein CoiA family protein [Chroococcidiopsis sp. TS-821]PPS41910.1 hypothetical protein B1A85_15615 [Chroococcidiopsis sp. TS-821]